MIVVINHPAPPSDWLRGRFLRAGVRKPQAAHACSYPHSVTQAIEGRTPMYRIETIVLGSAHVVLAIAIIALALH
jgi:hypothetical protein